MFELAFTNKLSKIDMMSIEVSKTSLKYLLKIHMNHVKLLSEGNMSDTSSVWELEESDRSELASVISSPRSRLRIQQMQNEMFPELKDDLEGITINMNLMFYYRKELV